ncbi:MAG: cyclopropane-fatty-acyl-phospholipid synthase family protein [Planctomycetes bacterium]|nr:cyclopropane-fatty-acyl-phospholipid synthase family protein [Planctomycetota bacterium]
MLSWLNSPARQLNAARNALSHLAEVFDARVSVRLWNGSVVPLGKNVHPDLCVSIAGPGVIGSLLRRPTLENVVRQYAAGHIGFEGGDLIEFGDVARVGRAKSRLRSARKLLLARSALPFLFAPAESADAKHAFDGEETGRVQSKRNNLDFIQFHYDLGNDFYALFLDPEMQYSCAYFTDWQNSLEQAQRDKLEMICRKLRLKAGERMLDIGCGWGGLICHAASRYGVHAHGVTLSQTQFDYTQEKIRRLGLEDRVTVELRDYSTLEGTWDKIASIGMYEHVGIANYPAYFGKIYSLLRDRGILLNHGITRRAKQRRRRFRRMRPEHRLMARYIFPGGELDHVGHTCESLEASRFEVHDVENWREHYWLTTRFWCRRLSERREEAIALVGPERYRLWVAYLAGVSFAFADGTLGIYQVVASKRAAKGRAELPPTREDLYRRAA